MTRPRSMPAAPAAFLFLLLAFPLSAQEAPAASEVPEVRLPDLEEEVGSVAPRDVEAPLPAFPALPLPADEPPLPADRELAIPESAYRTEATLDTAARTALRETFTEASVGTGLWDAISANLSIYRPGSDPSFSMTFSHDMKDGFAFRDPGRGFSERRTALNGRVRGAFGERDSWTLSASFLDEAAGLQGRSDDFYGVSHRWFDVAGGYERTLGSALRGSLEAFATAGFSSAGRALELAQAAPAGLLNVDEISATPGAGLALRYRTFDLTLQGAYDFRGLFGLPDGAEPLDRLSHHGRADLSARWTPSSSLELGAAVGWAASTSFPLLVPFRLSADAGLGGAAALSVEGGLRTDTVRLAGLWRGNPYLDVGVLPPDDARWYAKSKLDFFLVPGLTVGGGAEWALSLDGGGRAVPVWVDDSRALFDYSIEEYATLLTRVGLRWALGGASLSASWEADWLDAPVVGEAQRLKGELEYRDRNEAFGGACSASADFSGLLFGSPSFQVPVLSANGFVRLSPEIRFIAELVDIFAAFLGEDGRTRWAPYLTSGFQASARILISL